jgi:RNA processing factor Prp31
MVLKQKVWEGFREGTIRRAKVGGLFSGPTSGYPMELHGTELVVPVNSNSILMKLATEAETNINDAINNLGQANKVNAAASGKTTSTSAIDIQRIESISSMFDNIIDAIDATDDIDKKILRYT